jgi:GAF domain-containing protein
MSEAQPTSSSRQQGMGALPLDVVDALIEELPDAITIFAVDGTIVRSNRSAIGFRDLLPMAVGARFDAKADAFHVRDATGRALAPEQWPIARALSGEIVNRMEITITNVDTRETRIFEIDAVPILDRDERIAFAMRHSRDVTTERREREELERLYASEHVAKQDAERANQLLRRLNRLATELERVMTPQAVADTAARSARRASDASGVVMVRLASDGATLELVATDGLPAESKVGWERFPVDRSTPLGDAVRSDEPVFVSSPIERRARFPEVTLAHEPIGRAWAAFPLHQTGLVAGAIGFAFDDVRTFPEPDIAFLSAIADHCSTAFERAMLLEDSERARREAEEAVRRVRRLEFVTDAALSDLPFEGLLDELLERVRTALEADSSTLLLAEGGELRVRATRGLPRQPGDMVPVPAGKGVAGRIFETARPLVVEDLSTFPLHGEWLRVHMRSLVGVPLRVRGGLVGVLHVATIEPRAFTDDDVQLLELVGARVGSALERASLYGER